MAQAQTRDLKIELMLQRLQAQTERIGDERTKARRRTILRGMRIACWAMGDRMPLCQVEEELHAELFGTQPGAQCPQTEVTSND
ncbi:hypothetical protein [Pseudomonas umsongensis]|uniref:Uncharacterized protein n=1 Tax=Pseudomonas umsongensis TaxID=198618 RepID=A0AAE6ZS70_9PSED|nr:hypothetical protein [Pseudomonas umsongensis]QJC78217.1 hypothetical protein HGP31_07805 [Pseudomonas umsongensis]